MNVREVEEGREEEEKVRRSKVIIRWSGEDWGHEALLQEDGPGLQARSRTRT